MRQLQSSTFLAICLARLKCFLINIILINHAAIYYNHIEFKELRARRLCPRMDNFERRDRKRGAFFVLIGFLVSLNPLTLDNEKLPAAP